MNDVLSCTVLQYFFCILCIFYFGLAIISTLTHVQILISKWVRCLYLKNCVTKIDRSVNKKYLDLSRGRDFCAMLPYLKSQGARDNKERAVLKRRLTDLFCNYTKYNMFCKFISVLCNNANLSSLTYIKRQ